MSRSHRLARYLDTAGLGGGGEALGRAQVEVQRQDTWQLCCGWKMGAADWRELVCRARPCLGPSIAGVGMVQGPVGPRGTGRPNGQALSTCNFHRVLRYSIILAVATEVNEPSWA